MPPWDPWILEGGGALKAVLAAVCDPSGSHRETARPGSRDEQR